MNAVTMTTEVGRRIDRMRARGSLSLVAAAIIVTVIAAPGGSGSRAMQTAPADPERTLAERFGFSAEEIRSARSG